MKSFELQLYKGGKWKTDSIYDDRKLAELEARRIDQSPRYDHVRVIEEVYDDKTGRTQIRTVFRGSRFHEIAEKKAEEIKQAKQARARQVKPNQADVQFRGRRGKPPAPKEQPKLGMIAVYLTVICLVGIVAMVGLKYLSQMTG